MRAILEANVKRKRNYAFASAFGFSCFSPFFTLGLAFLAAAFLLGLFGLGRGGFRLGLRLADIVGVAALQTGLRRGDCKRLNAAVKPIMAAIERRFRDVLRLGDLGKLLADERGGLDVAAVLQRACNSFDLLLAAATVTPLMSSINCA